MNDKYDYTALGQRIRRIRKKKGLTQEKLAELCGLSTAHIGHIERGTRALSIESLITISSVLEISTDYLLLDITNSCDKNLLNILKTVDNAEKEKYNKLYSVVKILAENIDRL